MLAIRSDRNAIGARPHGNRGGPRFGGGIDDGDRLARDAEIRDIDAGSVRCDRQAHRKSSRRDRGHGLVGRRVDHREGVVILICDINACPVRTYGHRHRRFSHPDRCRDSIGGRVDHRNRVGVGIRHIGERGGLCRLGAGKPGENKRGTEGGAPADAHFCLHESSFHFQRS